MGLDMNDGENIKKIMATLPEVNVGIGMAAAAMCLITWEYLCTIPLSLRFLFSQRSGISKLLFVLNRYVGVYALICLTLLASGSATRANCAFLAWSVDAGWGCMSLTSIFVLLRRTWCISNRDNSILIIILPFALFMAASVIAVLVEVAPYWVGQNGVCLQAASQVINPLRLRVMISASALYDFVIMAVTVYKLRRLTQHTGTTTPFIAMLESHSIFYYVLISVIDLTVFGVSFFVPTFITSIAPFLPGTTTVAVQRIMLEDVDFSTRNHMHHIRAFIDRNVHTVAPIRFLHQSSPSGDAERGGGDVERGATHSVLSCLQALLTTSSRGDRSLQRSPFGRTDAGVKSEIYIHEEREVRVCDNVSLPNHPYARSSDETHKPSNTSSSSGHAPTTELETSGRK